MDLDGEVISLRRRVTDLELFMMRALPLLADYEQHQRRMKARDADLPSAASKRDDEARKHLDDGNLDAAGKALHLDRSHGGDEPDESYERRLRAQVDGAEAAGAVKARPLSGERSLPEDEPKEPGDSIHPWAFDENGKPTDPDDPPAPTAEISEGQTESQDKVEETVQGV